MIKILGEAISAETAAKSYDSDSIQKKIIEQMHLSSTVFNYDSLNQLKFELDLRGDIINAAKALHKSGMVFKVFRDSRCNKKFWNRSDEGGFRVKEDVKSINAIKDIFKNGPLYATECATAIIIVFYRAIIDQYTEAQFEKMFSNIYLMNWKQLDPNLGVRTYRDVSDDLPGDCRYFKNPEVDPLTPEWQGENVINLGNGTYYGHGIGINNAEGIISALNRHRKPEATQSAYLLDIATRPGFKRLEANKE